MVESSGPTPLTTGGHLLETRKDGIPVERYKYDEAGRRIADHLSWLGEPRQFIYYYDGSLIRLDDEYLAWTEKGQLQAIYDRSRRCGYVYGNDTRLDSVFLPSGKVITYEYGHELMPVRITEDSEAVAEYEWEDLLKLVHYVDIRSGLNYTFSYGEGRAPEAATISGRPDAIEAATGIYAERLTLRIGVDQVDSIRLLATPEGRLVKCVEYDSFGNVTKDSRAALRFPLGFACGLNDTYTGFVRFGFRDYHPLVGRFTAKDPVGYTGGDNDLWDYCVDDPVSCSDPLGLWTQENFDESKVTRDENGKFASSGSSESGGWKRQIGLGTAAVIDGLATVGDAITSPARAVLNYGNGLLGGDPEYFKPLEGNITNSIGLPKPQAERERSHYSLQEGTASILGATNMGSKMLEKALVLDKDLPYRIGAALDAGGHTGKPGKGPQFIEGVVNANMPPVGAIAAGGGRQESIQALPKAPPAIPNNQPLTRFEELAIKGKLADRETLPQYSKVTAGGSLNPGHSKGFETRELRASDDILVYVKNSNVFAVPLEVKAGSSFTKSETQGRMLLPGQDVVLRFRNHGQLTQYLSIDSQSDSFLLEYQVYSRGHYAPR